MIEVTRGGQFAGEYTLRVGEEMLVFLERGTLGNVRELVASIDAHSKCDLTSETGCLLSQAALINQYGSLERAQKQHIYPVDCSEDLAYLYHAMTEQMQMLFQSRYLRSVRDAHKALPSRTGASAVATAPVDNTPSLLGLQEPVTSNSNAIFDEETGGWKPIDSSATSTGTIPKVEEKSGPKHKLEKSNK